MRRTIHLLGTAMLASLVALPAAAQDRLEGWFIALKSCEAYQSKNALTNPGDVALVQRTAYDMIGVNQPGGDWFQIRVPGAPATDARWVATSCGVHVAATSPTPPAGGSGDGTPFEAPRGDKAADLLLALSWQPAFCEARPAKVECKQVNDGLLPITERQLSLHGLWPQPNGNVYCGVPDAVKALDTPDSWGRLPAPQLDAATVERLDVAMPGRASHLDRHEWIKHGVCFPGGDDGQTYFSAALSAMDAVNGSGLADLLASRVGGEVSGEEIRAVFDRAFGAGAGDRVTVKCSDDGGRTLFQEVRISLKGDLSEGADLGALMRAAQPAGVGCRKGVVDPVGLQ